MKWKTVRVVFLLWLAMTAAGAQPPDEGTEALERRMQPGVGPAEKKEIAVDMFVNYGFAYRDGTWVPLDVMVRNPSRDVTGWLEVRTYAMDQLQSPVYRTPIESPRDSTKRFQVGVFLRGATRIEVQLFSGGEESGGGRQVLDFAPYLDVTPIENKDLMVLVLDEDATGFGFLNMAAERQEKTRRLHRETLPRSHLPRLASWPQCYDPFDCIVMANTDPEGIGTRQRELLYDYVSAGGTLAVCTGDRAEAYHGTWIEELAGVTIGAEKTVNEPELAAAVFDEPNRAGARDFRQIAVAALEPRQDDVARLGERVVLATRRDIGSGHVYVLAVDPESRALQSCEGFVNLWQDILRRRQEQWELNMDSAAEYAANTLPRMSGIVIHSKSSVMLYLLLYFFVAIVGNWLVFNWLKRREWFWVTLVVFAVGFTGYAMVFGTSGRASKSELHKVEVVRLARQGGSGRVYSNIGVLTARTASYTIEMANPYALAQDLTILVEDWRRPGSVVNVNRNPFYLVQAETPKVTAFRVGASEMRLVQFNSDAPVAAHVEGTVTFNEQGMLEADIRCDSDFEIRHPFVWVDGGRCNLVASQEADGTHYRTNTPWLPMPGASFLDGQRGMGRYGNEPVKPDRATFRDNYMARLFTQTGSGGVYAQQDIRMNTTIGPLFGGWIQKAGLTQVRANRPLDEATNETLLLADVCVAGDSRTVVRLAPLGVYTGFAPIEYGQGRYGLPPGASAQVFVGFPQEILDADTGEVRVTVNDITGQGVAYGLALDEQSQALMPGVEASGPAGMPRFTYSLPNWRDHLVGPSDMDSSAFERFREATAVQGAQAAAASPGSRVVTVDGREVPGILGDPVRLLVLNLRAPLPQRDPQGAPGVSMFSLQAEVVIFKTTSNAKEALTWH